MDDKPEQGGVMTDCPDCGLPHDMEPCQREGATCACCDSIMLSQGLVD
jgi:pyrimidine deaminase RibD-like protein